MQIKPRKWKVYHHQQPLQQQRTKSRLRNAKESIEDHNKDLKKNAYYLYGKVGGRDNLFK